MYVHFFDVEAGKYSTYITIGPVLLCRIIKIIFFLKLTNVPSQVGYFKIVIKLLNFHIKTMNLYTASKSLTEDHVFDSKESDKKDFTCWKHEIISIP